MTAPYTEMNSAQLVAAYNQMAGSPEGLAVNLRPVIKFTDKATGVARCEKAASSIQAWTKGQQEEDNRKVKDTEVAKEKVAKAPKEPKAPKVKVAKEPAVQNGTWGTREGSNRDKLIQRMLRNENTQISSADLAQAVYGDPKSTGPLGMVLKGVVDVIKKTAQPYDLKKSKDESGISFGLHRLS